MGKKNISFLVVWVILYILTDPLLGSLNDPQKTIAPNTNAIVEATPPETNSDV
jgi:hypothetical protein